MIFAFLAFSQPRNREPDVLQNPVVGENRDTFVRLGKASRREPKMEGGDKPVEATMQSNIAGIAAGGTCPKLVESEAMRDSMESLFVADISKSTLLGILGDCRESQNRRNVGDGQFKRNVLKNPILGFFFSFILF